MFRVEIKAPSYSPHGVEPWIDHAGNEIWSLTFSKEHHAAHIPGNYPLESLGSVYRNIDDFRQNPLQSRTDWEIRIPLIYSSPDGIFRTVDLLYFLESVNEDAGLEFDLVGCEASLYDGDAEIYAGIVESIQIGDGTASVRISDWLGNPKIDRSNFPASIGVAEVARWQPIITKDRNCLNIEVSARPLQSKPDFYMKIGEAFSRIDKFSLKGSEELLSLEYSAGYKTVAIKYTGDAVLQLPEDIGTEDTILLPTTAKKLLRPDASKETPDYYSVGEGNDFEIFEAWSGGFWSSTALEQREGKPPIIDGYSIGRPEFSARRSHPQGSAVKKLKEFEVDAVVSIVFRAESIIVPGPNNEYSVYPPYTTGNPSQLAYNSRLYGFLDEIDFESCPKLLLVCGEDFDDYAPHNPWEVEPRTHLIINMSDEGMPDSTEIVDGKIILELAMKSATANGFYYTLCDIFTLDSPTKPTSVPIETDGEIRRYTLLKKNTIADVRQLKICISMGYSWPGKATLEEFLTVDPIQVGYARVKCQVRLPLDGNKLYVSGELETSHSIGDDPETGTTVKRAVQSLLDMAGANGIAAGPQWGLRYGNIINREAFALRDKLRSLAAESATLIKFHKNLRVIAASDISLQNDIKPVFIPMDAFLHENNAYYFRMESADRSDLLTGVVIHWGKNIETGEYAHTFSALETGLLQDGEEMSPNFIAAEKWMSVLSKMHQNSFNGIGTNKIIDAEWITSWNAAENMAYNLLRWNSARLRTAQARFIYTVLNSIGEIDIGSFVSFDLPGYPEKFSQIPWIVTGRQDDLDGMVATLELLEACGLPAVPPNRYLLLEDTRNLLLENSKKIKLEDMYG